MIKMFEPTTNYWKETSGDFRSFALFHECFIYPSTRSNVIRLCTTPAPLCLNIFRIYWIAQLFDLLICSTSLLCACLLMIPTTVKMNTHNVIHEISGIYYLIYLYKWPTSDIAWAYFCIIGMLFAAHQTNGKPAFLRKLKEMTMCRTFCGWVHAVQPTRNFFKWRMSSRLVRE